MGGSGARVMNMNYSYEFLRRRFDTINELMRQLTDEKLYILDCLRKVCPHNNLIRIEPNPVLVELGLDDGRPTYQCLDCFTSFDKSFVPRSMFDKPVGEDDKKESD